MNEEKIISNLNDIDAYIHCGLCIKEIPDGISPRDFASFELGWTPFGLQIWCKRHDCNVIHIDFEGHQHPADTTRRNGPRLVARMGERID